MMRQLVHERERNFDFLFDHPDVGNNTEESILAILGNPLRHRGSKVAG